MNKDKTSSGEIDKRLTFTGHLIEIRRRLMWSVLALIVTTAVSLIFTDRILKILIHPAGDIHLIYTEMTEMFSIYMVVALTSGVILAMPFFVYHIIMFVSPALTRREKKYVYIIIPWITVMFMAGVAFAYFVALPPAMHFLLTFGTDIAQPQIKIGNYISLVTKLLLAIGCVFETPVIITFLARLGVVSPQWLAAKRKWAFLGAFILAAVITPTMDPINQSLVACPLVVLYELSIWLSKLVYRKRAKTITSPTSSSS
jgi:sec-independent protein translocase protein TatC